MVTLHRNGVKRTARVHKLVAEAFLGPCPEGLETNHKDTNKLNNDSQNLEYITGLENTRHVLAHGCRNHARGTRHASARLTEEDVFAIRRKHASGKYSNAKIARHYAHKVTPGAVDSVIYGRSWKHLLPDNGPLPVAA